MISPAIILTLAFGYLLILFAIAFWADKRAEKGRSLIDNPYVYSLSLAVYCTAWTFYGSVGRASESGLGFLPIYIGPTLMAALWFIVLRKMIRLAKYQRITSIADFIGSRYGKSTFLAGMVAVIAVVGIIPYISLQLKAISTSYLMVTQYSGGINAETGLSGGFLTDTSFYMALVLALFTILFGTRNLDASEKHEGMVAAIAFESLVKLFAFIAAGLFVVFFVYSSPFELLRDAYGRDELRPLMTIAGNDILKSDWIWLTILSMPAILLLPRQFQTAVVENVRVDHVRSAAWMFPLYLLIINLFVLPIALAGLMHPALTGTDADSFVLTIPLAEGWNLLAVLVFIGGISAATSMVIVAAIALSTMISNDLVMPSLLRLPSVGMRTSRSAGKIILNIRRVSIVVIILLAYLYFRFIGEDYTLVSIGLVSFAAVAQFAPALFIGLYWKNGTKSGAIAGIITGFLIWSYTLALPSLAGIGGMVESLVTNGPFGIGWLKPDMLFGLEGFSPVAQSVFWSLTLNTLMLIGVSNLSRQSVLEVSQAALFVEGRAIDDTITESKANTEALISILKRFLGPRKSKEAIAQYEKKAGSLKSAQKTAPPSFIRFVENQLTGAIGSASAKLLLDAEVSQRTMTTDEVRSILDETRQVLEYSRMLEDKSLKLEKATQELQKVNEQLKELDEMKDEFVATVTHELKTPLTSIRALTEILHDSPDIEPEKRKHFLSIISGETDRLTRLINQLLDSQKFNTGKPELDLAKIHPAKLLEDALESMRQVLDDNQIKTSVDLQKGLPEISVDADRITQILLNLISNAVKYANEEQGEINIKLYSEGAIVCFSVIDNGNGIATGDFERIFEPFGQAKESTNRKPGTGLGLSISRKLAEAHGGSLRLDYSNENGTCFILRLPV